MISSQEYSHIYNAIEYAEDNICIDSISNNRRCYFLCSFNEYAEEFRILISVDAERREYKYNRTKKEISNRAWDFKHLIR